MTFEEFLKTILPKIGPNAAFDLSRDAQFKAIKNILIEKGVALEEEIEAEAEKCFGEFVENILKMPPIPASKIEINADQKN